MAETDAPLIFLVAGEASGDLLGARLMAALKTETGGAVRFAGVGGEAMRAEGLTSLFPMSDLSVMGIAEVLPHLPKLLRRIAETAAAALRLRPAAVVTIDSPDFSFRVAKRLRGRGIPLIHYVAPSVWAWKPGRAAKIARIYNRLLALLPFEPPLFQRVGLPTTFVGHPVIQSGADRGDGPAFRRRHGIADDVPLLAVLPGSRRSETSRLLPVFAETLAILRERHPTLQAVVPTVEAVAASVEAAVASWPVPTRVVRGSAEKFDAFAAANAALAASGTVSLELAMAQLPMVIAYRVNALTAWVVRRVIQVKYASLANILLEREAVPERIQENCTPPILAAEIETLLGDPATRQSQIDAVGPALDQLGRHGPGPSLTAARAVLATLSSRREEREGPARSAGG